MNGSPLETGFDPNGREPRLWILGEIPLSEYTVRAEFDGAVADDFAEDLAGNFRHRLLDFLPQVAVNAAGRVELRLTVPGPDLWTTVLTAMSVVTQSGYEPVAVQVTADDVAGGRTPELDLRRRGSWYQAEVGLRELSPSPHDPTSGSASGSRTTFRRCHA